VVPTPIAALPSIDGKVEEATGMTPRLETHLVPSQVYVVLFGPVSCWFILGEEGKSKGI
jgi:hypothetical protein